MTCEQECIQRCKNDGNIVIAGNRLYDFDNSNYAVATNDPDVEGSNVSSQVVKVTLVVALVVAALCSLKSFSLNRWKAVGFKLSCCF